MTNNQINAAKANEERRANYAREKENIRANKAKEGEERYRNRETNRHNRFGEKLSLLNTLTDNIHTMYSNLSGSANDRARTASNALANLAAVAKYANDPSWYKVNDQVVKDACGISVFEPLGSIPVIPVETGHLTLVKGTGTSHTINEKHRYAVSGAMIFNYLPTIGNALFNASNSDPINLAAQNIYSYVRHANSGSSNYERADYMMYLLACDSIVSYYAWMRRLYALCFSQNIFDRYVPKTLVENLGVDYDNIIAHLADFRAYINTFVTRSNVFAIVNDLPYYARHAFLAANVFTDSTSRKHQLYVFNPYTYYKWEIDSGNNATKLSAVDPWSYNNTTILSFDDIRRFGNMIIQALIDEEDVGIMAGDTLKAYGENGLMQLPYIGDIETVTPIYSDEILNQINNITFAKKGLVIYAGTSATSAKPWSFNPLESIPTVTQAVTWSMDVLQNVSTQTIYQNCYFTHKLYNSTLKTNFDNAVTSNYPTYVQVLGSNSESVHLNFVNDNITPDDVMVATRLAHTYTNLGMTEDTGAGTGVGETYTVDNMGSEIVFNAFVVTNYWDDINLKVETVSREIYDGITYRLNSGNTSGLWFNNFELPTQFISDFDWHPRVHLAITGPNNTGSILETNIVGLDNNAIVSTFSTQDRNISTTITKDTLAKMHNAALLGEYNIASAGITPRGKQSTGYKG